MVALVYNDEREVVGKASEGLIRAGERLYAGDHHGSLGMRESALFLVRHGPWYSLSMALTAAMHCEPVWYGLHHHDLKWNAVATGLSSWTGFLGQGPRHAEVGGLLSESGRRRRWAPSFSEVLDAIYAEATSDPRQRDADPIRFGHALKRANLEHVENVACLVAAGWRTNNSPARRFLCAALLVLASACNPQGTR